MHAHMHAYFCKVNISGNACLMEAAPTFYIECYTSFGNHGWTLFAKSFGALLQMFASVLKLKTNNLPISKMLANEKGIFS